MPAPSLASSDKSPPKSGHRTLSSASNLANLLPTGTVLVFQALIPSFSNEGKCNLANKYLTAGVIIVCSLGCFFSSFTDSFLGEDGKLYYGIATINGLYIFNDDFKDGLDLDKDEEIRKELKKYAISLIDFVHAFASLVLFLVVACSSLEVQRCFFPKPGPNVDTLVKNLPLGAGFLAGTLFMIFPTRRRGIGYGDMSPTAAGENKQKEMNAANAPSEV